MPLVEQKLLTLPEHLSSPMFLVGLVLFSLYFCNILLTIVCPFVLFSFGHITVCPCSNYGFFLPLVSSNFSLVRYCHHFHHHSYVLYISIFCLRNHPKRMDPKLVEMFLVQSLDILYDF